MSIRFKIFTAACAVCLAARLAEYHFQQRLVLPAAVPDPGTASDKPQDSVERTAFLQFEAQVNSAETGLAVGEKLLADDPTDTKGRAGNFLLSLCDAGQFQMALQFANEAPADLKPGWLKAVFTRWVQSHPQEAMNALDSIQDESERALLFQTMAEAWAANNPATFANFAESMPDGENKTYALNQVVDNWSLQDPEAFAAWLNTSPSGVNFDQAIAEMISKTDSANRTPQTAMGWVESINDPTLKYNSLVLVLGQWNESDPAAAQNYLNSVSWIDDSQRQVILQNLQTPRTTVADASGD
jgi:hypothetical protein